MILFELLAVLCVIALFFIICGRSNTNEIKSRSVLSIAPNSTVVYAGEVGIWTNDVSVCMSCGLKGHIYQQNQVCIKCGEPTENIIAMWKDGRWIEKNRLARQLKIRMI